jgi:diguanylate cyclase (GGDEF)-like protein
MRASHLRRQVRSDDRLADRLTELPSRPLLCEQLEQTLDAGRSARQATALLLIDLDGFKRVNETLGPATGDLVLVDVARRLRASLAPELLVARVGGDEFAVLAPRSEGRAGALETAAEIRAALQEPVPFEGTGLTVDTSIGIALAPDHADDAQTLVRRAEMALARARAHRSVVEIYSVEHDRFEAASLKLLGQVLPAIEREELVLFYQPKLDLESGRATGVEALLRWRHPQRGMLAPMEFMPVIEQTALIGTVTRYVIDRALGQLAKWHDSGLRLGMSVNLSMFNLHDPELPEQVCELLSAHGTPEGALTVEVTESAAMADADRALRVLSGLRASGVGVSIDDFGSGHASISYLARLPVTELKIDPSLVRGACESLRDEAIVETIVDMARHMDLRVVAEGVETSAVIERLTSIGCDELQGYFVSHPLPAEQATEWLREHVRSSASTADRGASRPLDRG